MKLSKIYSNKPFKNIEFNLEQDKLNVIVGSTLDKKDGADSHNLGKSKLLSVIDFLLLKQITKNFFLLKHPKKEGMRIPYYTNENEVDYRELDTLEIGNSIFEGYDFYLEILTNNNEYVTIKRSVNKHSKVSIRVRNEPSKGFLLHNDWDYQDVTVASTGKEVLNTLIGLDFSVATGTTFRKTINYSLRMQGDYDMTRNSIFQLSKFSAGAHIYWKPLVFALLGFEPEVIHRKYELDKEIEKLEELTKKLEKEFGVDINERDVLIGEIQFKEKEIEEFKVDLESLNYSKEDKKIINQLVGEIETEIAEKNSLLYRLKYDIDQLQKSLKDSFAFDKDRIERLFKEVGIYFPDQLSKSYDDLIDFNKKITVERNIQVKETLSEKQDEYTLVNKSLDELNKKKKKSVSLIQNTDSFSKYKQYNKKLNHLEIELSRLQAKLEALDQVKVKRQEIKETKGKELSNLVQKIDYIIEHTSSNNKYTKIRQTFAEIAKEITNYPAYLSVVKNNANNIDFVCKYDGSAKDEGNSYYKLLCIAFDLALHSYYSRESYFRFIFHDDAFANMSDTRRVSLLNTVREYSQKYNLQYIFSIIDDDIPSHGFDIDDSEIILRLDDKSSEGKLFYIEF